MRTSSACLLEFVRYAFSIRDVSTSPFAAAELSGYGHYVRIADLDT